MARPIEPTPVLTGKDAQRLLEEVEKPVVITPTKQKELDGYLSTYHWYIKGLK